MYELDKGSGKLRERARIPRKTRDLFRDGLDYVVHY